MRRILRRWAVALVTLGVVAIMWTVTGAPAAAQSSCGPTVVTADQPMIQNRVPRLAFDGRWGTFFMTNHFDWQYVQVDFGCVGTFAGLDRLMSYGYTYRPSGRGAQGECTGTCTGSTYSMTPCRCR